MIPRLSTINGAAVALCLVALLLNWTGCAKDGDADTSQSSCNHGRRATLTSERFPASAAAVVTSPVLVVGCGTTLAGQRVELVGYDTSSGLCFATDTPARNTSAGAMCMTAKDQFPPECVQSTLCIGGVSFAGNADGGETLVTGEVAAEITRVKIAIDNASRDAYMQVILGRVDAAARRVLGKPSVGYFAAFLPGCVAPKHVWVVAENADGEAAKAVRGENITRNQCRNLGTVQAPRSTKRDKYKVTRVVG
ncbi:MAG: hypothetical protein QOF13_2075 [Solirubrobacterales bacterium]|nr:hypothetical protein [Solirubrobacterales bacterium]